MLILVLAAVIGFSQGTKDKPVAGNREQQEAAQPAERVVPPIHVTVTSPAQSEEEKNRDAEQRERDVNAQETMARFTVLLFVLGIFQFFVAAAAVVAALRAADSSQVSADAAQASNAALLRADTNFQMAERAYLAVINDDEGLIVSKMEHKDVLYNQDFIHNCVVRFIATNRGNTPARVTDTLFDVYADDLPIPRPPVYDRTAQKTPPGLRAYLVKDSAVRIKLKFTWPREFARKVTHGEAPGWIYGYVDYIDAFGVRHRAGYARKIKPTQLPTFFQDTETEEFFNSYQLEFERLSDIYNYDRIRVPGEGIDWDEPQESDQKRPHAY